MLKPVTCRWFLETSGLGPGLRISDVMTGLQSHRLWKASLAKLVLRGLFPEKNSKWIAESYLEIPNQWTSPSIDPARKLLIVFNLLICWISPQKAQLLQDAEHCLAAHSVVIDYTSVHQSAAKHSGLILIANWFYSSQWRVRSPAMSGALITDRIAATLKLVTAADSTGSSKTSLLHRFNAPCFFFFPMGTAL